MYLFLRVMPDIVEKPLSKFSTFAYGEFTSAQERCLTYIWYGLAISPGYPRGEEGGYFTRSNYFFLPSLSFDEGGGGQHPVISSYLKSLTFDPEYSVNPAVQ
jgi:hypothetical protein